MASGHARNRRPGGSGAWHGRYRRRSHSRVQRGKNAASFHRHTDGFSPGKPAQPVAGRHSRQRFHRQHPVGVRHAVRQAPGADLPAPAAEGAGPGAADGLDGERGGHRELHGRGPFHRPGPFSPASPGHRVGRPHSRWQPVEQGFQGHKVAQAGGNLPLLQPDDKVHVLFPVSPTRNAVSRR